MTENPTQVVRKNYLSAMAVSLGASPDIAGQVSDHLLSRPHVMPNIDHTKGRHELGKGKAGAVVRLGRRLLEGSPQREQLAFTVGSRALSLLREDPKSGFFSNLGKWVDYWTDGTTGRKFRQIVGQQGE